jgi:F-type H+-transporting ATPase subunit delta
MATRLSRRKITEYVAAQLATGVSVQETATSLAAFLIDTRRTGEVELIIRDIEYQLAERGIVLASVVSAYELSDATKTAITSMIETATHAKTIELEQRIDPSVLGGVRIDIPGRQLDGTISRRLSQLTTTKELTRNN